MADANLYRFSSKEFHANSGMVYYLYRYYEPTLQRWPNRDPKEEGGGFNLYEFAGNNPVGRVDPDGRFVREDQAGPYYPPDDVPTGIYYCESRGETSRPFDHGWIQGDGWGAGFYPHVGGPKPPHGEGKGLVEYPNDEYYLRKNKSHTTCYEVHLGKCCDVAKFKKCVLDTIKQDQATPPRYDVWDFYCAMWATSVLNKCKLESCK
jgi:RHS repeat-associated protein